MKYVIRPASAFYGANQKCGWIVYLESEKGSSILYSNKIYQTKEAAEIVGKIALYLWNVKVQETELDKAWEIIKNIQKELMS